jgi:hypothetical protein
MKNLSAAKIGEALSASVPKEKLRFNRHQRIENRLKVSQEKEPEKKQGLEQKQRQAEKHLRACAQANFSATMKQLGKIL